MATKMASWRWGVGGLQKTQQAKHVGKLPAALLTQVEVDRVEKEEGLMARGGEVVGLWVMKLLPCAFLGRPALRSPSPRKEATWLSEDMLCRAPLHTPLPLLGLCLHHSAQETPPCPSRPISGFPNRGDCARLCPHRAWCPATPAPPLAGTASLWVLAHPLGSRLRAEMVSNSSTQLPSKGPAQGKF